MRAQRLDQPWKHGIRQSACIKSRKSRAVAWNYIATRNYGRISTTSRDELHTLSPVSLRDDSCPKLSTYFYHVRGLKLEWKRNTELPSERVKRRERAASQDDAASERIDVSKGKHWRHTPQAKAKAKEDTSTGGAGVVVV